MGGCVFTCILSFILHLHLEPGAISFATAGLVPQILRTYLTLKDCLSRVFCVGREGLCPTDPFVFSAVWGPPAPEGQFDAPPPLLELPGRPPAGCSLHLPALWLPPSLL